MKCLIYARVSTDKQDVTNQLDACTKWCAERYPDTPVEVFRDPDTSSRLPIEKRLALSSLLDIIKKGDVFVVFKLDRIARDIIEMVTIHRLIECRGAKVHSISEPDLQGWMLGIFGALAQKEREDISLRIKSAHKARKDRTERYGEVPYGFKVKGNMMRTAKNKGQPIQLVHNPKEVALLREIDRLRAMNTPWRQISEIVNQLGYRNRREQPWSHERLYRIHSNWQQNWESK